MNISKSEALYEQALTLMPGGVNSPVRACRNVGRTPLFIDRAKGSHIWDVDGNEFLDYVGSWGPNILGAADPEVLAAVQAACEKGLTFGACHAGEVELASRIRALMPSVERVRLVNSGTEAVMSAVRAARGFTGREKIVKFEGCYHGHADGLLVKAGSGLLTHAVPDSAGVPAGYTASTLVAQYNQPDSVEELFAQHGHEIACVIVEPCAANMGVVPPELGFLQFLREITAQHGALLLFDEVITGFRLGLGGAQGKYGIVPDLTALGKIVGGGMPLAAYGGRKEIMDCIAPVGSVYQAGTLSGNPVAVAAGNATLRKLAAMPELYTQLEERTAKLADALRHTGHPVNQEGSLLTVFFTDRPVRSYADVMTCDRARYADFYGYLIEHGIYAAPSQFEAIFVSAAHTEEEIRQTCEIIRNFR